MEFFKFVVSVVAGSAIATAMLGGVVHVLRVVQNKSIIAADSKALIR